MARNQEMIKRLNEQPVSYPFSFTMCGDPRPIPNEPLQDIIFTELLNQMNQLEPLPNFHMTLGDFSEDGSLRGNESYLSLVDHHLSYPNLCIMGNHDYVPEVFEAIHGNPNYFFTYGNCLFVAVRPGNHPHGPEASDLDFLEQCLIDHKDYPFKVVFLHQPPNLFDHYNPVGFYGFRYLEGRYVKLLFDYKVKLVCSAHITGYDWYIQDTVHFVVSGGGGFSQLSYGPPLNQMPPYRGCFHHFVQISVSESGKFSGRVYRAYHGTRDLVDYRFGHDYRNIRQ